MQFETDDANSIPIEDVQTPALLVDLDVMETNVSEYLEWANDTGVRLRSHVKTHKNGDLACYQSEAAGDAGCCCQTLSEAETIAEYVDDIYLSYNVVGIDKLRRAVDLSRRLDAFATTVDDRSHVDPLDEIASKVDHPVDVILEIDVGLGRTGVEPGTPAVELAKYIDELEHVELKGILAYEAHVKSAAETAEEYERLCHQAMDIAAKTVEAIEEEGVEIQEVKAGGTATSMFSGEHPIVTEVNPGMYPFNDVGEMRSRPFAIGKENCAATVVTTVISVPDDDRAVVDGGSKTFSLDKPDLPVPRYRNDIEYVQASEEHGWLDISNAEEPVGVGDLIEFIVPHVCTTINLHDEFLGVREDVVERRFPVHARGNVQ